jgi:UMF1 family MFS transporter
MLKRLALHKKEYWSWAMYDFANSAFACSVMVALLPVFYAKYAASGVEPHIATSYWAFTTSISMIIVAVASPVIGIIADKGGTPKKFLKLFTIIGALSTAALFFIEQGGYSFASILYIIAASSFAMSNVFCNSLLPLFCKKEDVHQLSASGYAVGYFGGGVLLIVNLLMVTKPEWFGIPDATMGTKLSFLTVAAWWIFFSIPTFRNVPEQETSVGFKRNPVIEAYGHLITTFKEIKDNKKVFYFLAGFWLYSDGIGTIMKMATIYGHEVGVGQSTLIGAIVLVQFVGVPFSFLFGSLAGKLTPKVALNIALGIYCVITTLAYFMTTELHFWALAFMVGLVQGGAQAISRSMFADLIPKGKESEFFGFYSLSDKFAGIFGPLIFGIIASIVGESRYSILFLVVFFIVGMVFVEISDRTPRHESEA